MHLRDACPKVSPRILAANIDGEETSLKTISIQHTLSDKISKTNHILSSRRGSLDHGAGCFFFRLQKVRGWQAKRSKVPRRQNVRLRDSKVLRFGYWAKNPGISADVRGESRHAVLQVTGMTCSNCSFAVERWGVEKGWDEVKKGGGYGS